MKFDWDPRKARTNLVKHGVSFEEATTAFNDPFAKIFDDPDHSIDEVREIHLGESASGRLLVISFTERDDERIRIISARLASRRERAYYEQ